MTRRFSLVPFLLLFILLFVPGRALSQQIPGVTQETAEPTPTPAPAPVPEERNSAQATIRTFIMAFVDAAEGETSRIDDAIACLDLSEIPELSRPIAGRNLAIKLKEVIDRVQRIEFDAVSDDPEGEPYRIPTPTGAIVISRQESGEWLFTADTVAQVDSMFEAVQDRELVAGVVDVSGLASRGLWLRGKMPERLRERAFILEHWQWITLLVLIFIGIIGDRLTTAFLRFQIARRLRRWIDAVEPDEIRAALRPFGLLVMALIWQSGLEWLDLPVQILTILLVAVRFVAVAAAIMGAYRLVDVASVFLAERAARTASKFDDLLVPLFRKSLKIFVVAFGLVFMAETLKLDYTTLLTGLGLGGVALAFGSQEMIASLFGSLTIILDRPFEVGDWIVVGDAEGNVEEVGFRSTRIRTFYNSLVTVPNATMMRSTIDNLGARRYRRWKTILSVTYDTPPEKIDAFCEGIRELVRRHPYTRKDYFHVYLNDFGPASLNILLYVFHETPEWSTELRERHRLALDILRLASRLGVEFAFPTQTLYTFKGERTEPATGPLRKAGEVEQSVAEARREAQAIVESLLGKDGAVPPPVKIEVPPTEVRGEGDGDSGDDSA